MLIQTIIHRLEVGGGTRYVKYGLLVFLLLGLLVSYNMRGYKNMSTQEAMDTAQLARNIAEHKGYTTFFIRPFSIHLVEKAYADQHGPAPVGDMTDRGRLRSLHPDLANAPVYPVLLAGLMKLDSNLRYQTAGASTLDLGKKHLKVWNHSGNFSIYPPDFWISFFNQCLFLGLVVMVFFLARRLFDDAVAWTASGIILVTDLFWRFSISGLSTILLMVIFLTLAWCLTLLEQKAREATVTAGRLYLLAAVVGLLTGLGCLTRYSFGWLIIPVVAFLILFLGRHRLVTGLIALITFAAIISPWIARNYHVSHTLFGTAGYAACDNTYFFPENELERSLHPDLARVNYRDIWTKLVGNTRSILQDDLPRLGGNWLGAFFLVGLLLNFRNPTLSRLRYFVLMCLPVLVVAQAMGRTHLTDDSPVINSENLLVLLAPLVCVFGVSLFYILLDQLTLPLRELRFVIIGAFCVVVCLPAILNLVLPHTNPIAYPPYYPPNIQVASHWLQEDEMMMSDIPWAVAWYGKRPCVWLTANARDDFFEIYDFKKPINALYLTELTTDRRYFSQCMEPLDEPTWGHFLVNWNLRNEFPPHFPLEKKAPIFPVGQFFLSDRDRWTPPASVAANTGTTNMPPAR